MRTRWLGRVSYREAWDLQRALAAGCDADYLLLLEHPSTFTIGAHGDASHMLTDPATVGAELVSVDRGGDITYHGPGQLVGYPIRTVGPGPHRGPEHVAQVEQLVIEALVALGVPSGRIGRLEGRPGVWFDPAGSGASGPRKVAAVGVRTTRGRTTHGFALNVTTDLEPFRCIVPCGLAEFPVTSLAAEGFPVTMIEAVGAVMAAADRIFGPVADDARVTDGAASAPSHGAPPNGVAVSRPVSGRSLDRRMARAGIDPEAGVPLSARKPEWLRVPVDMGSEYLALRQDLASDGLVTVCEEAGCPNIYECWSDGTATFMINGSRCTRACAFCQVDTGRPVPLDPDEPAAVAAAVARMGLAHAVITCVARDDLADGGASAFVHTIHAVRQARPETSIEVLISDFGGDREALASVAAAGPDVVNHNIETVARLQRAVRPSAGYARSLTVLARAADAGRTTKSGIILGMGENEDEVVSTMADLRAVGVEIVTLGQYLRPSAQHLPVARWWTPEEFDSLRVVGEAMGFAHVQASPLTRSSYHAREATSAAAAVRPPGPVPVALEVR